MLSRRRARYHYSPFPIAPSLTKRDRFRITSLSGGLSCRPKAASDIQRHSGSPHLAYRMATAYRPPVPLHPVDDLLVLAFRDVTLTITMGTPFPWRSPSVGNPVFRHHETLRASCRCLIHHLHETSLVPILPARIPRTATSS
jgi:hypothetical protein